MTSTTLIIMAAGDSTRFCNDFYDNGFALPTSWHTHAKHKKPFVKKQWIRLNNMPLWLYVTQSLAQKTLECFHKLNIQSANTHYNKLTLQKILITASKSDIHYMGKLIEEKFLWNYDNEYYEIPIQIVCGGISRYESLKNAMQKVDSDYVIVNDCARFNTKKEVLYAMLEKLQECDMNDYDCIAPYLPVTDSVLFSDTKSHIALHQDINNAHTHHKITYSHLPRESLRLIQTPQISKTARLLESFDLHIDFSDETSAICALKDSHLGLVVGSKDMAKLTFKQDLSLLKEFILFTQENIIGNNSLAFHSDIHSNSLLIGQGSDIHAFEDSKPMWLCGIHIESDFGFKAHSDGDVGIHAIIDSILGAMNCGDIGELFPDTDNNFKNADSKILLQKVYDYCLSVGLEIINLDVTIIAQTPRISPYKTQMQECLAQILYLAKSQISIKATTAENLGFIGRKEGVFVQSIVQLKTRAII